MSSLIPRNNNNAVVHPDGIGPEVVALLRRLRSAPSTSRHTVLSVSKSTRIYAVGLAEVLELYHDFFSHFKATDTLNSLKVTIAQLPADGKTKLFTYVMAEDGDKGQFSYFCLAVRKYESAGEILVDYYLSTYEYSQVKGPKGRGSRGNGSFCSIQLVLKIAIIATTIGASTAILLASLTHLSGLKVGVGSALIGTLCGIGYVLYVKGESTQMQYLERPLLDGADGSEDGEVELNLLKALFIAEMINSGAAYLDTSNQLHFTGY